jgi:hypothetical protein
LSEKLQHLESEKLMKLEQGLDMLVTLLNLQEVEASPLLTMEGDLNDTENE